MNILVFIPTYNRPEMCLRLLKQIKRDNRNAMNIEIMLINDRSPMNYKQVRSFIDENFRNSYLMDNPEHFGKVNFWQTVNIAFQKAKNLRWDYFIMLGDDLEIVPDFFYKATNLYKSRPDIICINLLREYGRSHTKLWTKLEAKTIDEHLLRTGWVDMCFIAGKNFMQLLNYTIHQAPTEWAGDPTKSSGVGMQISQRIVKSGHHFHQVRKSLVIHGDHESQMHPEERKLHPLISNHEDHIQRTASLAAMPEREKQLQQVIKSLIPQVDAINVYLNNWPHVPAFLNNSKISVFRSQDEAGDMGDVGKFYAAEKVTGYHFTCDDDILYPPDYIETLIAAIEKQRRKAVVSFHGRAFSSFPINSYYNGHSMAISCLSTCNEDTRTHVVGTGVLGYHTDTVKITLADFKVINMSDIWFSIQCEQQDVQRIILKHEAGWLQYLKVPFAETIAGKHCNSEDVQVNAMNSINWKPLKIENTMNTLRPDVARKYYVPTIKPGKYNFKDFGDIDLCQITLEKADSLFERKFPFLKLKPVKTPKWASEQLIAPAAAGVQTYDHASMPSDIDALRKNTFYINKILQMDWKDLNHTEKLIFHIDQPYFLEKKKALFTIAEINNQMTSLHAKMKVVNTDSERAALLKQITYLDDSKRAFWTIIDDWSEPKPVTEKPAKTGMTLEEFAERDRKIKANNNYIWRNEAKTTDQKLPEEKRTFYATELERRKQELIDMGAPYNRKPRK